MSFCSSLISCVLCCFFRQWLNGSHSWDLDGFCWPRLRIAVPAHQEVAMSGGGEQPDILSVGILVKERWKVVSMPSCNSFSPLKIFLLGYWIQSASDYLSPFRKSLRHLLETSQIVRLVRLIECSFRTLLLFQVEMNFVCYIAAKIYSWLIYIHLIVCPYWLYRK